LIGAVAWVGGVFADLVAGAADAIVVGIGAAGKGALGATTTPVSTRDGSTGKSAGAIAGTSAEAGKADDGALLGAWLLAETTIKIPIPIPIVKILATAMAIVFFDPCEDTDEDVRGAPVACP
jgi:hypothetical protein